MFSSPVSSANDELEFVKMRYRTPTHMSAFHDAGADNMAFESINLTTEFDPHPGNHRGARSRGERGGGDPEQPPSYDTTMRNFAAATAAANNYYAADRQSMRSKASTRSKRSTHQRDRGPGSSVTYSEPVRDLPWVHITPSASAEHHMTRHYP